MPDFDKIALNKVKVGGEPVGYTKSTGTLHLAGEDLTFEQWQELERRVNLLFQRDGKAKPGRKNVQADPAHGTSSFLSQNLKAILSRDKGKIKDAPWWLRWLYDAVITKQEYPEL